MRAVQRAMTYIKEHKDEAYAIMVALKKLFDPAGLLNPDVIITDNPAVHLSHLKAMPAADPLVDRCIECGFCEPACPSNGLSLTPRQRIVLWRAMQDLRRRGTEAERLAAFEAEYPYLGIDTCAATGMCATRCPVGINTGTLMKQLKGPAAHPQLADWAAGHMDTVTGSARLGLSVLAAARNVLGEDTTARLNLRANRLLKQIPVVPAATPRAAAPRKAPTRSPSHPMGGPSSNPGAMTRGANALAPLALHRVKRQQVGGGGSAAFDFVQVHHFQAIAAARVVQRALGGAHGRAQRQTANAAHSVDTDFHDTLSFISSIFIEILHYSMTDG